MWLSKLKNAPPPPKAFLTAREAAEELGISEDTLRRSGAPRVRWSSCVVRYHRETLLKWVMAKCQPKSADTGDTSNS